MSTMDPTERIIYEVAISPACWNRAQAFYVVALGVVRYVRSQLGDGGPAKDLDALAQLLAEAGTWAEEQHRLAVTMHELLTTLVGTEVQPASLPDAAPTQLH